LPNAPRVTKRQPARLERLNALRQAKETERAEIASYMYGLQSWTELDLCRDAAIDIHRARQFIADFIAAGIVMELSVKPRAKLWVHHDVLEEANQRILSTLSRLHAQYPLSPSIPRNRIARKCQSWHEVQVTDALLDRLVESGALRSDHHGVALASFAPRLTPSQMQLREQLLTAWHEAALKPPEPAELCQILSSDEAEFRQLLDLCATQGELVHLGGEIFLHKEVETNMRSQLQCELANGKQFTVSQIRDSLATSRKFAVPICEYLDRIGFTRRDGDLRSLR
jgi:selenocysteine-specific elongation factor